MKRKISKPILIVLIFTSFIVTFGSISIYNSNFALSSKPQSSNSDSWSIFINENLELYPPLLTVTNEYIYVVGHFREILYIIKFDKLGNKIWESNWDEGNTIYSLFTNVDFTNNLTVVICSFEGSGHFIKIDELGNEIINKNITTYGIVSILDVIFGNNDSLFLTGLSASTGEVILIKLDSNGNFIWSCNLHSKPYYDYKTKILEDSSNNIYHFSSDWEYKTILSKMNSSGSLLWNNTFGLQTLDMKSDSNGNIYLLGNSYPVYNGSILKVNSSGIPLKGIYLEDYIYENMILSNDFLLIHQNQILSCYELNLTLRWNFSTLSYYHPNYYSINRASITQNSKGNIFILQSNQVGNTFLIEINNMGDFVSKVEWGGKDFEEHGILAIDSEDNIYFTCRLRYVNVWGELKYYKILVKNPQNGGVPPMPLRNFDSRDYFLFCILALTCIISAFTLISIIRNLKDIRKDNFA